MRLKVLLPVSLQHSAAVFDCMMWRRGSKGLPSGDGKESNILSKNRTIKFHFFMFSMFIILVVVIAFICYLKYCF